MTVLVGVRCKDGIVIGADSAATSSAGPQPLVRIQYPNKIAAVEGRVIVACTGSVGLAQRFIEQVQSAHNDKLFRKDCIPCASDLAGRTLKSFSQSGVQRHPQYGIGFGAFVAAPFGQHCELIEFGTTDFQPEIRRHPLHAGALGSGQLIAEPFLAFVKRVLWKDETPIVAEALLGVLWVLKYTCDLSPGGVGRPIQISTLKRDGSNWKVDILDEPDLQQMFEHVAAIEARIGAYPTELISEAPATALPEAPKV